MERYVPFEPGEYYHVYNRGVDKRKIFFSDGDWNYFQRLLYLRNDADGHVRIERCKDRALAEIPVEKPLVDIQAYSLMPNHFHLLVKERESGGISTYMRRLLTSYSMYMNKKYDRSGPLMCRPFRAKHVDSDEYLRWLMSYIHLNPLESHIPEWQKRRVKDIKSAKTFLKQYKYSSYPDYYGAVRDESAVIKIDALPINIAELESIPTMLACETGLGAS